MVTSFTPPLFSCPIHFHSICSATLIYFFPLNTPYRFLPERLCTSSSLCWNTFSNICMTSSLSFLRNFASQWGLPGPSYLQFNSSPFLTPHLYPNRHSLTPFLLSCSLWYLLAFDILNISPFHWLLYIASSHHNIKSTMVRIFVCFVHSYFQHLELYLVHFRHSMHICWVNTHFTI